MADLGIEVAMLALREKLETDRARVVDLFRAWDEDESGTIERREFCRGLLALGFDAPRELLRALSDELDEELFKAFCSKRNPRRTTVPRVEQRDQHEYGEGAH